MLNRRTLLGAAAMGPLLGTAVFSPAAAETPKDVIVMAYQIDDIISMDPQESFEFSGNEVTGNIYEKLIHPDLKDPTKILPKLAEKWETTPDGLTTTFHLVAGRKFASGNPVTAEDVVFTYTRAVVLNKAPAFIITQLGITKDYVAERVTAPDPHTVVIKLTEQFAPTFLFYCLSANVGGIVDKKTVMSHETAGDMGNAWLKT
ncbi:MAG: ABC transporter substrate-binding protein, partial [Alphaproteobacteria bacterium]